MQVRRIGPDGAFVREFTDVRKRVESLETRPAGEVFISQSLTTRDPNTGEETIFGLLPDGTYGILPFVGDTTPPPVATMPFVSGQPGMYIITWDGKFVGNAEKPRDFLHVNVWAHKMAGTDINGTTTVLSVPVGIIRLDMDTVYVGLDIALPNELWQFSLESEDYNGNKAAKGARSLSCIMQDSVASLINVENAIADLDEKYDGVVTEAFELDSRLATAEDDLAANTLRFNSVDGRLVDVDTKLVELDGKYDGVITDASNLDSRLETAETDLVAHEERLVDNDTALQNAFGQLATVDTRVSAAQAASIAAAAADATAKKELAEANAAVVAQAKADAALTAAKADALAKANAAQAAAIAAAAADATAKKELAEANAATAAAADATSKANAAQAAALAAAKTYADAQSSGASQGALDAAKADATAKADAAKAAAIAAAAADATAKKELAEANAAVDAKTKADNALATAKTDATTKSDAAKAAAITAAAADATTKKEQAEANAAADAKTKADNALAAAKLDATAKADAAKAAAISSAAADATAKQQLAESNAATAAAAVAQTKADAAQAAALASAKTYADAQASGASATALATAKADATTKADAAKAAAITAAALDATAKQELAEANAAIAAAALADAAEAAAIAAAADDATTKANDAASLSINAQAYSLNPSFDDWTGTTPAKYSIYGVAATKETTIFRRGPYAARFVCDATVAKGLNLNNGALTHAPNLEYWTVEVSFQLVSGSLTGAGVLLDWTGLTPNRSTIVFKDEVPTPILGKWYTVTKTIRRPTTATGTWTAMTGYLMANYAGSNLGALTAKDIIFDWINVRPATAEEINAGAALTMAGSKSRVYYNTSPASGVPTADGDLWRQRDANNNIIAEWRWDGIPPAGSWVKTLISSDAVSNLDVGKLTAGSATIIDLVAQKIAAGTAAFQTVDVKNLYATASTLDQAVITKLWTDVVNSQKITTQMLAVGDFTNLIPNAQLQSGTTGFTPSNTTLAVVTATGGVPGLQLTATSATLEATAYAEWVDVIPGEKIRLSYSTEGSWSSGNGAIYAQKMTVAGAVSSFNPGVTNATAPRPDHSYVVTIPSDAIRVRFRPYISASASIGSYLVVSNMMARRMTGGELVVDGSITTTSLAANAVTAKNIVIGDFQNFAIGSDFEDATAVPWTLATQHTISTTQKKFGASSLRLSAVASASSPAKSIFIGDLRVKEGEQYYFKLHAYLDASFNGTGNTKLRISDAVNNATVLGDIQFNTITRSAWTTVPLEKTITIPAGITALKVELWNDNTAGLAYVDDIQIRRMSEASLISNLGVEKLVATSATMNQATIDKLWADVVHSRKITTDMMVISNTSNLIPDPTFTNPESLALKKGNATGWDSYVSGGGKIALRYGSATPSWPAVGYLNLFDFDSTPGVADKTGWLPVGEGEVYEYYGSFYANDASITTKMYVSYLKNDGTTSGYSSPTVTPNTANAANQTPKWEFTIPADVIKMGARLEHRGTTGWVSVYGDGQYFRKKVDAALVVDGAITAKKLEATLVLASEVIAGNPLGTHAKMNPAGFHAMALLPGETAPKEVISIGTANDDYFGVTDSTGKQVASISSTGAMSALSIGIDKYDSATDKGGLSLGGTQVEDMLDAKGGSLLAWASRSNDSLYYAGTTAHPYLHLQLDGLKAGRAYMVQTTPIHTYSDTGSVDAIVQLHLGPSGRAATVADPVIDQGYSVPTSMGGGIRSTVTFNRLLTPIVDDSISLLISCKVETAGRAKILANGYRPVMMTVTDIGLAMSQTGEDRNGTANAPAGGNTGGEVTAPAVKKNYDQTWNATGIRSFLGSGGTYAFNTQYMYSGLQYGTSNGDLSSMAIFPSLTSTLSGATITGIWVYVYYDFWYYGGGGDAYIGMHGQTALTSTKPTKTYSHAVSTGWPRAAGRWIKMSSSTYAGWVSGTHRGITLGGSGGSYERYGYAHDPKIRITWTK